jgi:hypothetical protein
VYFVLIEHTITQKRGCKLLRRRACRRNKEEHAWITVIMGSARPLETKKPNAKGMRKSQRPANTTAARLSCLLRNASSPSLSSLEALSNDSLHTSAKKF